MKNQVTLVDFGMFYDRGFLPKQDPLTNLSIDWKFLDDFGHDLSELIKIDRVREAARMLPIPSPESLATMSKREQDRAMMIYGFGASAFVHSTEPSQGVLCKNIAQPLCWLSSKFNKPPILSYCSYSLNNWKRIDPSKDIELGNIKLLQNFIDLYDEDWFILVHVEIERKASLAIEAAINAISSADKESPDNLRVELTNINHSLNAMIITLKRMPEHCSPDIYYKRVRPWIKYFENVIYQGVDEFTGKPQSFRGETGAQSSIMPFLEATFGLTHKESVLTQHLRTMRLYMPTGHRLLIESVETTSKIREFIVRCGSKELKEAYNACLEKMFEFRDIHFGYAHSYIHQKTANTKGTGGTIFMPWLEQMRHETRQMLLK